MPLLTPEVHALARRSVLCWLATVDATGQPNVSPKELFALVDDRHLVIANIASPRSVRNLEAQARVCVGLLDIWVQKGFKVTGQARYVRPHEPDHAHWAAPLLPKVGDRFALQGIIVVRVQSVEAILAPSYRLYPGETTEAGQVEAALRAYGVRPAADA